MAYWATVAHDKRGSILQRQTTRASVASWESKMSTLNLDILHEIMDKVADTKAERAILLNLSLTCRQARESIKPILFSKVKWPHLDKFDEKSGLHFFPELLWTFFRWVSYQFVTVPYSENSNLGPFISIGQIIGSIPRHNYGGQHHAQCVIQCT